MSDKLTKQLAKLEAEFEGYKKEFARDGKITPEEAVILKSVSTKLGALRKKIVEYNEKRGIVDFGDEPIVVTSEVKPFEDAHFTTAFEQSIKDWSQDGNIALNRVKTYFIKGDSPESLSLTDVLSVVGLALTANPKAAAVVSTISTIVSLVEKAYKASLPSTPSLNEIHSAWATALTNYGNGDHKQEYAQFVTEWKKNNGVGADVDSTPVNVFLPACKDFAKTYLPTASHVEKAFLSKVLSHVQDGWDLDDRPGLSSGGTADVRLIELVGHFSQPDGQLDDVSEQLLEAVKTVWARSRVIDLPVQIQFEIVNVNLAEKAVIQRASRTAGDTNFKLLRGESKVYDAFLKAQAYNIPRVSDLTLD
jgi:hypothetical protein